MLKIKIILLQLKAFHIGASISEKSKDFFWNRLVWMTLCLLCSLTKPWRLNIELSSIIQHFLHSSRKFWNFKRWVFGGGSVSLHLHLIELRNGPSSSKVLKMAKTQLKSESCCLIIFFCMIICIGSWHNEYLSTKALQLASDNSSDVKTPHEASSGLLWIRTRGKNWTKLSKASELDSCFREGSVCWKGSWGHSKNSGWWSRDGKQGWSENFQSPLDCRDAS